MAASFVSLTPITLTSGSATRLASDHLYASSVIVYADDLNTGNVYIGGDNVTTSNGIPLSKGKMFDISHDVVYGTNGKIDLSTLYLDTDTTNNLVRVIYVTWMGF